MKLEKANIDNLKDLWDTLEVLMSANPVQITKRSATLFFSVISLIGTGISSLVSPWNSHQIHHLNQQATIHTLKMTSLSPNLFGQSTHLKMKR